MQYLSKNTEADIIIKYLAIPISDDTFKCLAIHIFRVIPISFLLNFYMREKRERKNRYLL